MTHTATDIRQLLRKARVLAVVGLTDDQLRPSYGVAAYMQAQGYRIVPVNPALHEVLGEPAYPSLSAIPFAIDLALLFRRPEAVAAHVEEAIALGIPAIWMQPGTFNAAAIARAEEAGLHVVAERCIRSEHRRAELRVENAERRTQNVERRT